MRLSLGVPFYVEGPFYETTTRVKAANTAAAGDRVEPIADQGGSGDNRAAEVLFPAQLSGAAVECITDGVARAEEDAFRADRDAGQESVVHVKAPALFPRRGREAEQSAGGFFRWLRTFEEPAVAQAKKHVVADNRRRAPDRQVGGDAPHDAAVPRVETKRLSRQIGR